MPRSWRELIEAGIFLWPQSHLIPGMLREFDLPELAGMLEQGCDFEAAEPWDGFFRSPER